MGLGVDEAGGGEAGARLWNLDWRGGVHLQGYSAREYYAQFYIRQDHSGSESRMRITGGASLECEGPVGRVF